MGEFFFVLKTFAIALALVLLLQIKIGHKTLEQRSLTWMRQSVAIEALRGVADGAVAVTSEGVSWARGTYNKQFGGSQVKERLSRRAKWESEVNKAEGEEAD